MTTQRIALLGARGTGKTTLAQALTSHLGGRGAGAAAAVIITDSAALMAAIAADTDDRKEALLDLAVEGLRRCDAILLTGLDLPWPAGVPQPEPPREAVDALVREHLQRAGLAYQVVYGQGEQRLQSALQALEGAGVLPAGTGVREEEGSRGDWVWNCEKCSDPACEHRLFAKLRAAR